jgi:hypothetical protein
VAGVWGIVFILLVVAFVALMLVFVGVSRSIRASGLCNGRLFRRPAAPWTVGGLVLVAVDAIALVVWLLSSAGAA